MAEKLSILYEKLENQVRDGLLTQNQTKLRKQLVSEHPANIAGVVDRLTHLQRHELFDLLSIEKKAKVLDEMSITATRQVLDRLSPKEIGALLNLMPMDEAAEMIYADVPKRKNELLAAMAPNQAAEVKKLLEYPPESAGRMMTEKFAHLKKDMTVAGALAYVRKVNKKVETVTDLYVLEKDGRLIGVVSPCGIW